ncbi:MAG: orotidine 5'-phosphate decarboxylase / HUMPS family protein, partial [Acidimicrobiia bacterium]
MATIDTRNRLVLALDVDTADEARTRAGALQEWFGIVKVGLELFTRCGPEIVQQLRSDGFEIFLDLKLHDIPTTVRNAA